MTFNHNILLSRNILTPPKEAYLSNHMLKAEIQQCMNMEIL